MTRRCRLCQRSIEDYPSAARYCKEPGCLRRRGEDRLRRKRASGLKYARRKRAEQQDKMEFLRGTGLRYCRCGVDISHRGMEHDTCLPCASKLRIDDRLQVEMRQLHEMNPERWPLDVLAERYRVPIEQVQEAMQA